MMLLAASASPVQASVTADVLPATKTTLPSSLDEALKMLHSALNDNKKAIPAFWTAYNILKTEPLPCLRCIRLQPMTP